MADTLLFADLHNHSLLSDGEGDPNTAYAQLRAAGLDVAALTDHASIPRHVAYGLRAEDYPSAEGFHLVRTAPRSLDAGRWDRAVALADRCDEPGSFTALSGFEWTEPWLGHVNVWGSDTYLPVTTPGSVAGLHDWLVAEQDSALFGYNHPGREDGRLEGFRFDPRLLARMVTLEMFNRYDDYIAVGVRRGRTSPLLECLRAGWRPGLIGVSDEHGAEYGLRGKGRAGLWAAQNTRSDVRQALLRRQVYATREPGLRLRADLDGTSMGGSCRPGSHRLSLSLDVTDAWRGYDIVAQVLVDDGSPLPAVLQQESVHPAGSSTWQVPGLERYPWVVVRVAARGQDDATIGLHDHPLAWRALAYGSPWWLDGSG